MIGRFTKVIARLRNAQHLLNAKRDNILDDGLHRVPSGLSKPEP